MALDQSALLDLFGQLNLTDVTDRILLIGQKVCKSLGVS